MIHLKLLWWQVVGGVAHWLRGPLGKVDRHASDRIDALRRALERQR